MNRGSNSQMQSCGTWFGSKVKYVRKDDRALLVGVERPGPGC